MPMPPGPRPDGLYVTVVRSRERPHVSFVDEPLDPSKLTNTLVLGALRHMDGNEFEAVDSHCPVCGGKKVRFIDRKFLCDGRCELGTWMVNFILDRKD